jgi:hypothetical protein
VQPLGRRQLDLSGSTTSESSLVDADERAYGACWLAPADGPRLHSDRVALGPRHDGQARPVDVVPHVRVSAVTLAARVTTELHALALPRSAMTSGSGWTPPSDAGHHPPVAGPGPGPVAGQLLIGPCHSRGHLVRYAATRSDLNLVGAPGLRCGPASGSTTPDVSDLPLEQLGAESESAPIPRQLLIEARFKNTGDRAAPSSLNDLPIVIYSVHRRTLGELLRISGRAQFSVEAISWPRYRRGDQAWCREDIIL